MNLADDFPPISQKQWKQQIQFELNGLDYNQTLLWENNGITIKPFYTDNAKIDTFNNVIITQINESANQQRTKDIISNFAKNGTWQQSQKEDFDTLKKSGDNITIDTSIYQNVGATIVQQLAYGLAIADEYIKFYGKKITPKISFHFAVGCNLFLEITKLNAISILWNRFLKEHDIEQTSISIITTSSLRNKDNSPIDNLRFITEQLISEIPRPATDGCFYIENSIEQFVEKSFEIFKLIKENNGFIKQLYQGIIQKKIKQSAEKDRFSPKIIKNIRKTDIIPISQIQNSEFTSQNLSKIENSKFQVNQHKITTKNYQLITDSGSGFTPFLRGISAMMYTQNFWKNKTISDFSVDNIIIQEDNLLKNIQKGLEIVKNSNLLIDEIAQKLIFSFNISGNHFDEIAKLRAGRVLWAKMIQKFHPKENKSMAMQIHCEILGDSISEKICNSLSAIFGGIQSLNTSEEIHQFLKNETFIHKVIDPWGGSTILENLTIQIINDTWQELSSDL